MDTAAEGTQNAGALYICATPIGNLDDVSARVLDALTYCDTVLAEDTRRTARLCARYGIRARLERCDDNVIRDRIPALIERLKAGERIAFCSDAGMPAVSDPGAPLVDAARCEDIEVVVLPGPSAVLTALVASGLSGDRFYFGGFLPKKEAERNTYLSSLAQLDATLVFYESPHRILAALRSLSEAFPGRRAALCRELTKVHEEVVRGTTEELEYKIGVRPALKGEIALVVEGPVSGAADAPSDEAVCVRCEQLRTDGLTKSDIVKALVAEYGIPRNRAYELVHKPVE